jgi:hypothetical protein
MDTGNSKCRNDDIATLSSRIVGNAAINKQLTSETRTALTISIAAIHCLAARRRITGSKLIEVSSIMGLGNSSKKKSSQNWES